MKQLTTFLLLLFSTYSFSQTYGNEWINYDQTYYSIKIVNEGIYKIDYQTLVNNGINPALFSSSNLQLFGREKEQPIYLVDGGDNQLNPGDYFIFYAQKNDGWLDSTLFRDPTFIGNPGYSMFNDTIHYFLTWNNSSNNLRFVYETYAGYQNYMRSKYCLDEIVFSPNTSFNPGKVSNIDPSSLFDPGEGYCMGELEGATGYTFNYNFDVSNIYTDFDAPSAKFHFKSSSLNYANPTELQEYNHHFKLSFGSTVVEDTSFIGYQQNIFDTTFATTFLSSNSNFTYEIVGDLGVPTDRQTINYMSLNYPKQFKLNGLNSDKFKIMNNVFGSKIRMDITNSSITDPIVLILGQKPKFINVLKSNDTIYTLVSNSTNGENQDLVIQDLSLINDISSLSPVNGNGIFTNFENFTYDSADLIIYPPKLDPAGVTSAVDNYIAYRSGAYNVVAANIEELYLQFGGGIEKHSNAIRRFALYAYNHSTSKPVAISILGKGLRFDKSRTNTQNFQNSLVPPFGSPGSDIFYTSFLQGNQYAPLIPIGRVSVSNEQDLQDYLNKLIEYENQQNQSSEYSTPTKDWQKQVLHFVGGSNFDQVQAFLLYMNSFKNTIEDTLFAGNVTTFLKYTNDPLDPGLITEIADYIEYGASILNFFGHSGSIGFDISVDDPSLWNNQGKYPVVIGNGCHSAAIFESSDYVFSEKIVETANSGGIAYFASGAEEYDITLRDYCGELYKHISYKNYGKPISAQIKASIYTMQNMFPGNDRFHSTLGATNLNGDPLIKVNYHNKPEIELLEQNISFNPSTITLADDTVEMQIILTNLGRSVVDSFRVDIQRDYPLSQLNSDTSLIVPKLNYKDTILFKFPLEPSISIGVNNFAVSADIPSFIDEQYEEITNNKVDKTFFLKVDGILPVLPYEFAVVPDDTVNVVASTINPIAGINTYYFEMDTVDTFNSPELRKKTIIGDGGVKIVRWNEWMNSNNLSLKPLVCTDSTVYFWRVAVDSSTLSWTESSFQYIKGKAGWGQDHFFQFKKNNFDNIIYNRNDRIREFDDKSCQLVAQVWDTPQTIDQIYDTRFNLCGINGEYGFCGSDPSIHVAVYDPTTLLPWKTNCNNPNGYDFGQLNGGDCSCRSRSERYFIFRQDSAQLIKLSEMLTAIPDSFYVLVYAANYPIFQNWQTYAPSLFTWFNEHGSQLINSASEDRAFIFYTKKGNNATTEEIKASFVNEFLTLTANLSGSTYLGEEKSTIIGPALEWKTVYWKQDPMELAAGDTTKLLITGINYTSNTSVTLNYDFTRNDSITNFNSIINASEYPYLKLEASYKDKENVTPAQIDRWHVLYSPVPEAAIDNARPYTLSPAFDTINEGQEFIFAADYKNISTVDMDSMLVHYWIEDADHVKHYLNYPRQDVLLVNNTHRDTVTINTTGFPGLNSLWMEINPYIDENLTLTDQPEQHHFNNILQIPFYVKGDDVNPILDVTFDSRHILNGDIVNPRAEILITLKDDNPFLVMDRDADTTLFGIFLTGPDGIQKRIPFMDQSGNNILQWVPAESQNKKFKIIYNANFAVDGKYTLLVQGSDRSGNLSGDLQYRINFEVINESSITHLMNYPNPFSTSTRFVFTLTGSEVPDDIIIQILTVTGKVVREITEDEIGPIYIGRNISQFAWNGTDEFGDALANGVYLYRVLSRINGEEIKHRESGADKYFKKEFGKMYLMR